MGEMRYLVGIGNYSGLDDSIGLRVAEAVAERGLDREFRAIDLGGNLIDLIHYIGEGVESVLIVDAAKMGLRPGEYAFFEPAQVESRKELAGFSTHEGDLLKVLAFAQSLGKPLAPITVMGIEPAEVRDEPGISADLQARFDEYVEVAAGFF